MKHGIDSGLTGNAKAALASKSVTGVGVTSDWASLTLKGQASQKASALAAVHKMGNFGALNTVKYICAGPAPCPGTPAGAARASGAAGAGASPSSSASGAAAPGSAAAKKQASNIDAQIRQTLSVTGVTFNNGSATLTPQGKSVLNHVAALLDKAPSLKVKIAGYTDNTGSASLNQSLSKSRANSTMSYLAAHGVAASRMSAAGYGEADPVASNATAGGRAKNRRIVFTVQGG